MLDVFSPVPIIVGEFDAQVADQQAAELAFVVSCSKILLPPNRSADFASETSPQIFSEYQHILPNGFQPNVFLEEGQISIGENFWHTDHGTNNWVPRNFIIGSTVRNPSILVGRIAVPFDSRYDGLTGTSILSKFLSPEVDKNVFSDEGQDAINRAVDIGDLAPFDNFEIGDLLLLFRNTLHRRKLAPESSPQNQMRVVMRQFLPPYVPGSAEYPLVSLASKAK